LIRSKWQNEIQPIMWNASITTYSFSTTHNIYVGKHNEYLMSEKLILCSVKKVKQRCSTKIIHTLQS